MTANRGTPVTMAPEIIKGHKNYTSKCDIYSIGIIMWQIIARKEPYNLCSQQDGIALIWNVAARDKRPPNLSCNIILSRFYERCWHSDPDKRPTSEEVKEYFTILSKASV
uniref:Mitogen-activated protein kinase kinase kinase n=1 Tax=Heterorhabditis bacteriophora TaxID=37862 RepID=A0A1I7XMN1_HETBA